MEFEEKLLESQRALDRERIRRGLHKRPSSRTTSDSARSWSENDRMALAVLNAMPSNGELP